MRKGQHKYIVMEKNKFIGFHLGSDFCAEHEWGIKELLHIFGIQELSKDNYGIKARQITISPKGLRMLSNESGEFLYLCYSPEYLNWDAKHLDRMMEAYRDESLVTAWCSANFGIRVKEKTDKEYLKELYEAFQNKDVVITLRGEVNPFNNAGLNLMIASKLDKDILKQMDEVDLEYLAKQEAFKKTGIEQILKDAGKKYLALVPKRWDDKDKKELLFWLTPSEHQDNNYGWFRLNDLKLWAENKGPIPKEQ